jgi:hypothetical protein
MVAALATRSGCTDALSFDFANNGLPDSGATIATRLGLKVIPVSSAAWRRRDRIEIPIYASGQPGAVIFSGAEEFLNGRVLLTGFSGDTIWKMSSRELSPDIMRDDTSGLGLTEYRLWAGFLHCPVPFWAARRAAQIGAISNSAEMRPYVISGSDYNRPICRRMVEDAGVDRDQFGRQKKAAEPYAWRDRRFLTAGSYQDYFDWLRSNQHDWLREWRLPPWRSIEGDAWINACSVAAAAVLKGCGKSFALACHLVPALRRFEFKQISALHPPLCNLRRYWFPWAVDRAKERYADVSHLQIEQLMKSQPSATSHPCSPAAAQSVR